MKIVDLFAELGVIADQKSIDKAQRQIDSFAKKVEGRFRETESKLKSSLDIAKFGNKFKLGSVGGAVGTFGRGIKGLLGGALGGLGVLGPTAVVAGAAAGLTTLAKGTIQLDDAINDLDISSRGAVGTQKEVRARVLDVSRASGVAADEVVAGAKAFVALTGDGKAAGEMMQTFAKVAKGQRVEMNDVAGTAAAMSQQFGIASGQMEQAFSILSAGGKAGAVEFKDFASLMAQLAAETRGFADSQGIAGLSQLSAMFQTVAPDFGGNAAEAATGLQSLARALQQHAKELKASGIDVYEKDGKTLRNFLTIAQEIGDKGFTGTKLFDLLGRAEAVKALNAVTRQKGAVESLSNATAHARDVSEDFEKRQKTAAEQLSRAWNTVKVGAAEAFTPERADTFIRALGGVWAGLKAIGEMFAFVGEMIAGVASDIADAAKAVYSIGGKLAGLARHIPGVSNLFGHDTSGVEGAIAAGVKRTENMRRVSGMFGAFAQAAVASSNVRPNGQPYSFPMSGQVAGPNAGFVNDGFGVASVSAPGQWATGSGGLGPQFSINVTAPPGGDANALASMIARQVRAIIDTRLRGAGEVSK